MKCSKCGWAIPEDSGFCPYCGTKVETVDHAGTTSTQTEPIGAEPPLEQAPSDLDAKGAMDSNADKEKTVKVEENLNSAIAGDDRHQENPRSEKGQKYCKHCGGMIDRKTKKCQGCGKQYFCIAKHGVILILATVCVVLIGLNVFQYTRTVETEEELEQAATTISKLEKTISRQDEKISSQKDRIADLRKEVNHYKNLWLGFPD